MNPAFPEYYRTRCPGYQQNPGTTSPSVNTGAQVMAQQISYRKLQGYCPTWPSAPVQGSGSVSDFHLLIPSEALNFVLEDIAKQSVAGCVGHSQIDANTKIMVTIFADNFYGGSAGLVSADRPIAGGAWQFHPNNIAAAVQGEQQAEENRKQAVEAAENARVVAAEREKRRVNALQD
jgi:hypothetical protein